MISTLADWSLAAALRAAVARSARCSIPVKWPSVRAAADEAELAGAAADIEDAGAGDGDEEFRRLGGDADGGPLEGRELSNPGRIDLVELLVFDGPRVLVFEVVFYLQHSME